MIPCLARDILLFRALVHTGMCLPSRCLAMGICPREEQREQEGCRLSHLLTLVPRSRIFYSEDGGDVPPKRRFTQALHRATSQRTVFFKQDVDLLLLLVSSGMERRFRCVPGPFQSLDFIGHERQKIRE
jgi:hypothetical protein